jgi:hypothetical protein
LNQAFSNGGSLAIQKPVHKSSNFLSKYRAFSKGSYIAFNGSICWKKSMILLNDFGKVEMLLSDGLRAILACPRPCPKPCPFFGYLGGNNGGGGNNTSRRFGAGCIDNCTFSGYMGFTVNFCDFGLSGF